MPIHHNSHTSPRRHLAVGWLMLCVCGVCQGQTTLKAVYGWGNAARLGRWTNLLVTVAIADAQPRETTLQIEGTYGTGAVLSIQQDLVVESRPRVYALLFPLNADPTRLAVTLRERPSGKILGSQVLLNPSSFSPAGRVPPALLAADGGLIGIGGNVGDALLLQAQLSQTGLASGIFNEMKLPASAVGYEGISALLLSAPELQLIDGDQEQAIIDWVAAGGNLVLIPSADPLPQQMPFDPILPCDIGVNQITPLPLNSAATQPSQLNGRMLHARPGSEAIELLGGGNLWTAYARRYGLGRVVVLPADVAELSFSSSDDAIEFWKTIFSGMVEVAGHKPVSEVVVSDSQEDMMPMGATMADSIGRGPRETQAARHLLDLLDASTLREGMNWRTMLPWIVGLCLLLGPVDWFVALRLGVSPWHWVTVLGWIGLTGGIAGYCAAATTTTHRQINTFRLVDQADGKVVAVTDLLAFRSSRTETWRMLLDPSEWWEPANQSAGNFGPNRFLEFNFREDRDGCRPGELKLRAGDPVSLRGQTLSTAPPTIGLDLRVERDASGEARVVGKLSNLGAAPIIDLQISTALGNGRIDGALAPGSSVSVDCPLTGQEIEIDGLPEDALDLTPDRTDRIAGLVKAGKVVCVTGEMPEAVGATVAEVGAERKGWCMIRAVQ